MFSVSISLSLYKTLHIVQDIVTFRQWDVATTRDFFSTVRQRFPVELVNDC